MRYPLLISPNPDGTFRVAIQDIPEAITASDDLEHATEMANDVFRATVESYVEDNNLIPMPSRPRAGQPYIEVPAIYAAKILLLNEMRAQNIRPSDLARKLNTRPQDINRLTKLNTSTRIDSIEAALLALGKSLQLTLLPTKHG